MTEPICRADLQLGYLYFKLSSESSVHVPQIATHRVRQITDGTNERADQTYVPLLVVGRTSTGSRPG